MPPSWVALKRGFDVSVCYDWFMEVERWPIVARSDLVRAFRPGESDLSEAPFRTLRRHRWATAGVSVVTRSASRAAGRSPIYSVLNVDAARLGRLGRDGMALRFAKAAARIEKGATFRALTKLLTGRKLDEVSNIVEGAVDRVEQPLHELLWRLALQTSKWRASVDIESDAFSIVTGRVSEAQRDFLVLTAAQGIRTMVPRWLAHAAHRENVGDYLALVTDRLDESGAFVRVVPAIDLAARPKARFSPYDPDAVVNRLTPADERLLARKPLPFKILVPVTIES
jgi:hypothetical protein